MKAFDKVWANAEGKPSAIDVQCSKERHIESAQARKVEKGNWSRFDTELAKQRRTAN